MECFIVSDLVVFVKFVLVTNLVNCKDRLEIVNSILIGNLLVEVLFAAFDLPVVAFCQNNGSFLGEGKAIQRVDAVC